MTTAELNRDIKRLAKKIDSLNGDEYFIYLEDAGKTEFKRLYYADKAFKYMNRTSILIMLRLNIRHRFIALHNFGLNIEIEELIK